MHPVFIVKATRLCNLRCSYCHDWRAGPDQRMPFRTMATFLHRALQDPLHESATFVWHGGETTLMPISFYRKALYIQQRLRRPEQRVFNAIQTNATRLTPEWATFLKAHEFTVGVSLDGPPELHDAQRRFVSGRGSFDAVRRGIAVLQEHEIPFTVLMVIDERAVELGPEYVFDALVSLGVKNYSLLSAKPTNDPGAAPGTPAEHYVDPERMCAFLAGIYDRWASHGDDTIRIRELRTIEDRLGARESDVCTLGGGCLGTMFIIEPSGEVAHCDLFLGDPNYTLGNVFTHSFADFRAGARMRALRVDNQRQLADMRGCPEFAVCNGWCPHERYTARRHHLGYDRGCCGLRDLIEHVRTRQTTVSLGAVDRLA